MNLAAPEGVAVPAPLVTPDYKPIIRDYINVSSVLGTVYKITYSYVVLAFVLSE